MDKCKYLTVHLRHVRNDSFFQEKNFPFGENSRVFIMLGKDNLAYKTEKLFIFIIMDYDIDLTFDVLTISVNVKFFLAHL